MPDDRIFCDPSTFSESQFPVIVLCDDLRGFLGFIIKTHTSGQYNHAIIMIRPGFVVTQNNVLKEIPISKYLKSYEMLKFWMVKDLTPQEKETIISQIQRDLNRPWWNRMYDYVGLLGQALWMPWLQIPWLHYCSEADSAYLRLLPRIASWLPPEPSPAQLDDVFKQHPETMVSLGYWWEG